MKFVLGSTSESKREILESFLKEKFKTFKLDYVDVSSDIVDQPLNKETTQKGAVNRAQNALAQKPDADFGIGLEGGLENVGGIYHLICIAAIANRDEETFIGESEPLALPEEVSDRVKNGGEFGVEIRRFFEENKKTLDNYQRDVVEELIGRRKGFREALGRICYRY